MIKHEIEITLHIARYPKFCKECPMFYERPYSCQNERGTTGECQLGYMNHCDTRDFAGYTLFKKCNIKENKNVSVDLAEKSEAGK